MKIRSAVPENGCLIIFMHFVVADGKRRRQKKTDCKTYTHLRHLAAQMRKLVFISLMLSVVSVHVAQTQCTLADIIHC